ncbi:type II secretion system protein [Sporosarcina sp. HYO08]|uniref:type II secretion system protein n=1 Tax=Sporosarcina sp. HYO08 TaxID=1759557 RepID=UPI00079AFC32|nr:prepilin-type N-terminal cleavage/methylation domain-containing protein [Sporosarcina sp. HYO08]KXH87313.1 hypothetical protein AU377_01695 [Sporosarcina sp. HYO08]
MLKKLRKQLKNEKGLTLVELLAVIVILAVIAAIAVPAIGNIIDNSRYNAVKGDAINALNAANIFFTDNPEGLNGTDTVTLKELKDEGYLESIGKFPEGTSITKEKPHAITGTSNQKVNGHSISFTGATIDIINADTKKAKDISGDTTIQ